MGTWGEGNFANDGALDFVGDLMHDIVQKIEACFADEYASALDEDGEAFIPGNGSIPRSLLRILFSGCGYLVVGEFVCERIHP